MLAKICMVSKTPHIWNSSRGLSNEPISTLPSRSFLFKIFKPYMFSFCLKRRERESERICHCILIHSLHTCNGWTWALGTPVLSYGWQPAPAASHDVPVMECRAGIKPRHSRWKHSSTSSLITVPGASPSNYFKIHLFIYLFVYLFEELQRGETELFHPLVHSPADCHSQDLLPGLSMCSEGQVLRSSFTALPGTLVRSWV